jgi:hypothetical protein
MKCHPKRIVPTGLQAVCLILLAIAVPGLRAADEATGKVVSCNEFLLPKFEIRGKQLGQNDCKMIETDFTYLGRKFRRMDMGVSGTIDGYAPKEGRYNHYFSANPEYNIAQSGNKNPIFYGVGEYDMNKGNAVIFIFPLDKSTWNGKEFVTAHGAGVGWNNGKGSLKVWDKNLDTANPMKDISKYEKLMLEKGYALAKTRRSTPMESGDTVVTLEDGTVLPEMNVTEQPRLVMGEAMVGWNVLEKRLGSKPTRTYWYGHSGGARPGRIVNYQPGLNVTPDGKHIIDGIIPDDAGSGQWQPVVMKNGKDVLFTPDEDLPWFVTENKNFHVDPKIFSGANHKNWFVPMIEIAHELYVNETPDDPPEFASTNFLANKRLNAKALRDKGLWNKFRMYEIDGISHEGGEDFADGHNEAGNIVIIDMSRLMDGFIDLLDNWVEHGVAPPPTRSNWMELGDANHDGINENPAIKMPEIDCPTGVYYINPAGPGGAQSVTGFMPFSGKGLEPIDRRGMVENSGSDDNHFYNYVDMNHNGIRDFTETMTEAWRRIGYLKPNEKFNRERYSVCVKNSVNKLVVDKFFKTKTGDMYKEQVKTIQFPSE